MKYSRLPPKNFKIKRIPFIQTDTAGGVLIVHWVQFCLRGRRAFSTSEKAQGEIWKDFFSKENITVILLSGHDVLR